MDLLPAGSRIDLEHLTVVRMVWISSWSILVLIDPRDIILHIIAILLSELILRIIEILMDRRRSRVTGE